MQSKSKIDGYTLVRDYSTCIAGRHECNVDAEKIVETLSKEEQKKLISDVFMAIMHKAREVDKKACPFLTQAHGPRCQSL